MALKRLPNDVQSLLSASTQINNYKRAVEELVYNSLDAESTSIAIRINIQEGTLQVIDNGCGITKVDFHELGQRYMTSKVANISSLQAAPKKYGYRGEFLANIITVSQTVKITSRHESAEETWAKTFYKGKEKKFSKMTTRPTNGTTVDIKGFLYNLHIQKSTINPIHDQQNIKTLLEQLSLVHNHISISLRDDCKNEIIFKIHKKRDIYQTLMTLFDIKNTEVVELQVEKNEYKVKGFIGKTDSDLDVHWIYLNRKCIHNSSKLHKMINDNFKKVLPIKDRRKVKYKKDDDENNLFKQNIPFYFAFITCPYIDYEISYTPKQLVIEFKNCHPIKKLLEKLVKFYAGDMNLKEIKVPKIKPNSFTKVDSKDDNKDTRNQVEMIMKKILGNNTKNIDVSQLQKGVKGKLIKRKKKLAQKIIPISKLLTEEQANIKTPDPRHIVLRTDNKKSQEDVQENSKAIKKPIFVADHIRTEKLNVKENRVLELKQNKTYLKPEHKTRQKKNVSNPKKDPDKQKRKHKISNIEKVKKIKQQNNKEYGQKRLTETDLMYEKSKMVAQRAEEFLGRDKRVVDTRHGLNPSRKYMNIHYDKIFLVPKNGEMDKRKVITYKPKLFQTTYDLLQTIVTSQREFLSSNRNITEEFYGENRHFDYRHKITSMFKHELPKRYPLSHTLKSNECINIQTSEQKKSSHITYSPNINELCDSFTNENCYNQSSRIPTYDPVYSGNITNNENFDISYNHTKTIQCTSSDYLESKLTYESHNYYRNEFTEETETTRKSLPRKQNIRFISKQSEENFTSVNIHRLKYKKQSESKITTNKKNHTKQIVSNSSFTIEYSDSNVNEFNSVSKSDFAANGTYCIKHTSQNHKMDQGFGLTYPVSPSILQCNEIREPHQAINKSLVIQSDELFDKCSNNGNLEIATTAANKSEPDQNNLNIVFVSKSQYFDNDIEPLNVCETVMPGSDSVENEFKLPFHENNHLNDTLYNNLEMIHDTNMNNENELSHTIANQDEVIENTENVSRHFSSKGNIDPNMALQGTTIKSQMGDKENQSKYTAPDDVLIQGIEMSLGNEVGLQNCNMEDKNFNLKNRPRFMPKGMSQIFENCRTKNACNYILDKDYYEDSIYNNFVHDVHVNTEIYEPKIQNVEDLTTRDIHKFQNKVKKNNASLIFDEKSLRNAKVLDQVDCKFIATIVAEKCLETEEPTEYLVLFDQHAVHERIRLENNLAEYIQQDTWKSTPLDNVSMKLSKDEILYLHNYKDKFNQLGLQWTILNENEIMVNSIPKAILGKNPREVEKVIKAVKHLIVEEINAIKVQKGCLALYPKSIMDLVFSEACRYAIKFGDHLSKNDCVQLIQSLSACKTPFQCAHGRPVMAVIMDIKSNKQEYKVKPCFH
ncbi:uncharacterized protein LOC113496760 [Trichoplusia ni]|uniref:Uncharacterized protein LOC113496760 n=1 Tax=Trichoplusia ni TaxID=7111 RepID=A0A7E5VU72_TRINI|nr:uncharacterized protein LOC113496760 [Trichoplusia ni]